MKKLLVLLVCSVTLLAGCKKSDSTSNYSVNVNVSGLIGNGVVLQMSNTYLLTVDANGPATFATQLPNGTAYWVTIVKQPALPAQTCTLANASGTISGANVTNITMTCAPIEFAYQTSSGGATVLPLLINPSTGALAVNATSVPTGNLPQAFTVSANGRYAFAVNYGDNTVSSYLGNTTNGILTNVGTNATGSGSGPVSVAVDPTNQFVYVANSANGGSIEGYTIDQSNGVLTCVGYSNGACPASFTATAGINPSSLTTANVSSGEYLYVTNAGSNNIFIYGISGAATQFGALTQLGSIPTGNNPTSIAVLPKVVVAGVTYGPFLYVVNATDFTVSGYSINVNNGMLTSLGAPITTGGTNPNPSTKPKTQNGSTTGLYVFPYSIAFAPNGLYAYVVNPTNNTIAAYSVAITGQLTSLGVTQVPGVAGLAADTTPISVSVDPSGAFVYTANYSDNSVTVFPVTANGTLGTPTAQTFGNNPISIVTVAN